MKKVIVIVFSAMLVLQAGAQIGNASAKNTSATVDTVPPYKKSPDIPPFKLLQVDSTWLTNQELPKNKPLVVIYFSPECGHCQLAAQEITNSIDKLKDATFLWVSYYSVPDIAKFVENYHLAQFNNFKFGRDPHYFLPTYFRVKFTPFMAVYDNNGQFVQAFEQGTGPEVLATLINDNSHNKKKAKHTS